MSILFFTSDIKSMFSGSLISFKLFLLIIYLIPYWNPVLSLPQRTQTQPRIVIVGAGASGIAAANKLMLNGFNDVTILEAMNKIGGRISWIDLGAFGGVDLGAHWIHGQEGNVIYEIAEPLGLVDHSGDYANQLFFRSDGTQLKLPMKFFQLYEALFGDIHLMEDTHRYKNFADVIDERLEKYGEQINLSKNDTEMLKYDVEMSMCTLDGCADLSDVSFTASRDYEEGEGDRLIHWKSGGMSNILQILMGTHKLGPWKDLGVNKKVKVYSRVANIDWSEDDVKLITESGSTFAADFVIFTGSLNVLKNKHKSIFSPSLPQPKVKAIEALGMDVVDKVYLVFKEKWWPNDVTGFNLLHFLKFPEDTQDWGRGIISFVGENNNPNVLGVWINGKAAKMMELASEYEVRTTVMRILRMHVGKSYNIPNPVFVIRTRWWNNEDVLGSYSYNSIASERLNKPRNALSEPLINADGKPMVLFAGEATSRNHYSTVNGAIETGWREAQRIIDYVNQKSF